MFITAASRTSEVVQHVYAALDAAVALAKPGMRADALHDAAIKALSPYALHPVLEGSIGRRIGFSLDEGGALTADANHTLSPGDVYTLQVGAYDPASGGALASAATVALATGADLLHRSPAPVRP
jgi:Xaa-Pro aminopeptidase